MALTQKGVVYSIGPTESKQYRDKTYYSRVLILEQPRFDSFTGEKLSSNYIKFEAAREDTCKTLDNFHVGNTVEVEFLAKGAKYSKKDNSGEDVFMHLEIRTIALASSGTQPVQSGAAPIPTAAPVQAAPAPAPQPVAQAPAPAAAQPAANPNAYDPDLGF